MKTEAEITEAAALVDKMLDECGYTREEAIENPGKVYPIPSPPYPAGRSYHVLSGQDMALVVDSHKEIVCTLPAHVVQATLQRYTPSLIGATPTDAVFRHPSSDGWVTSDANVVGSHSVQILRSKRGVYTTHLAQGNTGVVLLNQEVVRRFEYPAELDNKSNGVKLPGAVVEQAYFIWDESDLNPDASEGEQAV